MIRVTTAESQVMEALWARGAMTSDELIAEVGAGQGWGAATVKTLINRLMKKKALQSVRVDGRASYRPLLQRADYVLAESQGLLDRLFDGRLSPLVAHLAQHRALEPDEIATLKRLIEELENGD